MGCFVEAQLKAVALHPRFQHLRATAVISGPMPSPGKQNNAMLGMDPPQGLGNLARLLSFSARRLAFLADLACLPARAAC
jgi:hypothetical protein